MLSPANPRTYLLSDFQKERKRKRDDDPGKNATKRYCQLSPPSSVPEQQLENPPPHTSAYTRTLSIAAWVDDIAGIAVPPECQTDTMPSDVTVADSRASSSRSRVTQTQTKAYRGLIKEAGIIPETSRPIPNGMQAMVDDALSATPAAHDANLRLAASLFCNKTRELVDDDANESEWKAVFFSMVDKVCVDGEIKLECDRNWCEELLPQSQLLLPTSTIPQRRQRDSQGSTAVQEKLQLPNKLKKPRPDVQLSLAKEVFVSGASANLVDRCLRMKGLIANPSLESGGGFFPFLICKLKSGATGGNLYGAQNQASVAAAIVIRIFADLQAQQPLAPVNADPLVPVFAVCSESSCFQLFAYYRAGQDQCVGRRFKQWDSTNENDALDLVQCIAGIMRWAKDSLKSKLVQAIKAILEHPRESPDDQSEERAESEAQG